MFDKLSQKSERVGLVRYTLKNYTFLCLNVTRKHHPTPSLQKKKFCEKTKKKRS